MWACIFSQWAHCGTLLWGGHLPQLCAKGGTERNGAYDVSGTWPPAKGVEKFRRDSKSSRPVSSILIVRRVFRCPGVSPYGPPEEPLGKDITAFLTSTVEKRGLGCRLSSGGIGVVSSFPAGWRSMSSSQVSSENGATVSLLHLKISPVKPP